MCIIWRPDNSVTDNLVLGQFNTPLNEAYGSKVVISGNKLVISYLSIPDHCLVGRVFTNGPGDLSSISVRVTPKTLKMVLDTSLLNTQHYKVHQGLSGAIQGKE